MHGLRAVQQPFTAARPSARLASTQLCSARACTPHAQHAQQQQDQQQGHPVSTDPQQQRQKLRLCGPEAATAALVAAGALLAATPGGALAAATPLHTLSDLDASTAAFLEAFLRPALSLGTLLYIIRIPMTWYPSIDGKKLPWLLAYAPTEPFLKATRAVIPSVGGVDVTPIVWVALLSFVSEILLGPQGILMLIQRQSGSGL